MSNKENKVVTSSPKSDNSKIPRPMIKVRKSYLSSARPPLSNIQSNFQNELHSTRQPKCSKCAKKCNETSKTLIPCLKKSGVSKNDSITSTNNENGEEKFGKYVTVRRNEVPLDWNLLNQTFSAADTSDSANATLKNTIVTPYEALSTVKKVKRSLKRPHSKELQGIASTCKKDRMLIPKKLCFDDDVISGSAKSAESHEIALKDQYTRMVIGYMPDIVSHLLEKERSQLLTGDLHIEVMSRSWLIDWLVSLVARKGRFSDAHIIRTAVSLIDRVFTGAAVATENQQRVAAACYWVALKMTSHAVSARFIVARSGGAFNVADLCAAERFVMNELNYPSMPVIADDYAAYLIWWSEDADPEELETAVSFISCLALLERALARLPPSTLSVAALLAAQRLTYRTQALERLQTCSLYRDVERREKNLDGYVKLLIKGVYIISMEDCTHRQCFTFFAKDHPTLALYLSSSAKAYCRINFGM